MKCIPLTGKEYEDTVKMLDSFRPENLHRQTNAKNASRRSKRAKLAHFSVKADTGKRKVK